MPAAPQQRPGWPRRRLGRWAVAWPHVSLRMQLGVLLGTVAALAVAIPTVLHALVLLDDLERSTAEQNLEVARVVGALTEQRLRQTVLEMELLAASPGFAEEVDLRATDRVQERLAQVVRLDPVLSSVLVVDQQGVIWAHTLDDPRILSQDNPDAAGVQEALRSGRPTVGQAFRSVVTGRAVVRVIVPFKGRSGALGGALQALLSLEQLNGLVDGARGSGRGSISLYDEAGRHLAASDPALILTDVAPTNTAVAAALRGESAAAQTVERGGQAVYAAAIPLPHGWVVAAHQPVAAARASLYAQFVQNGVFALVAFSIAMVVGMVAAQRITVPLLALLRALRSIRRDEHELPLPGSSTAEVASLVDELQAMRTALAARAVETQDALSVLNRYRLLAEQMTDPVLFISHDATILEVNCAAEHAYGHSRANLVGRPIVDLLGGPEDLLQEEDLVRAFDGGLRFETTHRRADASTFPFEATLFGAVIDGQRIMISIARDITDRQRADEVRARMLLHEREVRAREERAAEVTGIIQHLPCGVLVFDTDGILVLANEHATDLLSPDLPSPAESRSEHDGDLSVPHPSQLLDDQLLSPCRALVNRALGGRAVSGEEFTLGRAGLLSRMVIGSAAPLRSPGGEIHGAVAVLVDVTRERRLVQDLTISESTLRHSLENLMVLHDASRTLSSTLDEEEIGRRLVQSCARIARLDAAIVFLNDGQGGMRLLGTDGDPLLIDHVLGCETIKQVRAEALARPGEDGVTDVPACADGLASEGRHVVLRARGETLGVLEIYGREHHTPVIEDSLASLAAHAVSSLDNARLYREVGDREQRLQDALRQLLVAQEEERRRVAYDLHDGLAQVAAATHLSLQTFASHYRPRSPETRQQLDRSLDLARRVVREARQAIAGLRPTALDDFGLERALRLHIQELVGDGWTIEYHAGLGPERLAGPIETVLFRITQEALTNVGKHAQTRSATVSLRRVGAWIELEVADRGIGFAIAAPSPAHGSGRRLGLVGMRERAGMVGGHCTVESRLGEGTRVTVRIPAGGAATAPTAAAAPKALAPSAEASGHVA